MPIIDTFKAIGLVMNVDATPTPDVVSTFNIKGFSMFFQFFDLCKMPKAVYLKVFYLYVKL